MSRMVSSLRERNERRSESDEILFDSDGIVAMMYMQKHVTKRFRERFGYPPAYARAEAQRTFTKLFQNVDLFDQVVTTKEHTFAIYDEKTGSVYAGQLWLDRNVPDVLISTYWYGSAFGADPDDVQIVVMLDGTVLSADISQYMHKTEPAY